MNTNQNKLLNLVQEDFYQLQKQSILEKAALEKNLMTISQNLYQLKESLNPYVFNSLETMFNNIDVIVSDNPNINIKEVNVEQEINKSLNELLVENKNINFKFCNINKVIKCDITKLLYVIKSLIMKSFYYKEENKINVLIQQKNQSTLEVTICNVVLGKSQSELKEVAKLLNIDFKTPTILNVNIDPDFLIIRQNLLAIANKTYLRGKLRNAQFVFNVSIF